MRKIVDNDPESESESEDGARDLLLPLLRSGRDPYLRDRLRACAELEPLWDLADET